VRPLDRGGDRDAEEVGQHGGRNLGGQLLHRGSTTRLSVDAQGRQSGSGACGGDRAAGQMAGKQPVRLCWGGEALLSSWRRKLGAEEPGEGLIDLDVARTEPDRECLGSVVDLCAGHDGDPGELLGVEQNEAAGDPIDGGNVRIVQQPLYQRVPLRLPGGRSLGTDRPGQPQPWCDAARGRPGEEVANLVGEVRWPVQEPVLELGLADLVELDVAGGQPVQQRDRGAKGDGGVPGCGAGSWPVLRAAPDPVQHPPGAVGAQDAAVLTVLDVGQQLPEMAFEPDQALVPLGQRAVSDEEGAKEVDGTPAGLRVQSGGI